MMNRQNTVTCSFTMDRDVYNAYKGIVVGHGENVKGNLVRYMMDVIRYETSNSEGIIKRRLEVLSDSGSKEGSKNLE